jgi:tRNA(adenine34) deaminase
MTAPPQPLRRVCLCAPLAMLLAAPGAWAASGEGLSLASAMRRAEVLRDQALRAGDQGYGAVVLRGGEIVGEAPSRVVTAGDPTAHAEMEAIRDAARRLRTRDLRATCWFHLAACRMCGRLLRGFRAW